MTKVWLIRNDTFSDELETEGFVSIGWDGTRDLSAISIEVDDLVSDLAQLNPDSSIRSLRIWAHSLRRFYLEMNQGDVVVAPYNESRLLRIGHVVGDYYYVPDAPTHRHRFPVKWTVTDFPRNSLSEHIQNGLRSIATLSRVRREPELFESLASNPDEVQKLRKMDQSQTARNEQDHSNTWLVGATIDNEDKTPEFVKDSSMSVKQVARPYFER